MTKPDITRADLSGGVEMGKINDGYFSNRANAEAFVDIGIRGILDHLGGEVRYAEFGGGEGFLPRIVADVLAAAGRTVHTLVVDANEDFLAKAAARGLATLCAELENVELADYDLITMRSVNHYNDIEAQQRIVDAIFAALKAGGFLVSQNLSGPTDRYCRMTSALSKLPSLGRVEGEADVPHMTSEAEFDGLMTRAGFADVHVAGHAPDIRIGPEYYWARFNAHRREAAVAAGDGEAVGEIDARHQRYLAEANALIERFLGEAGVDETSRIRHGASSYEMPLSFPIHVGRKPR
jgi:SAM-dependent methyltransferase